MDSATTTLAGVERRAGPQENFARPPRSVESATGPRVGATTEAFVPLSLSEDDELHHRLRLGGLLYGDCALGCVFSASREV